MKWIKYTFNILIIGWSLYIVAWVIAGGGTIGEYFALVVGEWLILMLGHPILRRSTFSAFYKKAYLGGEDTPYGKIYIKSIEKSLEQMEEKAFETLIADLLQADGYKVELTPETREFGADIVAQKNKETMIVQVKYRQDQGEKVKVEDITNVVMSMKAYGANRSMIVTNGEFEDQAINQAKVSKTKIMDKHLLEVMIRYNICKQKPTKSKIVKATA